MATITFPPELQARLEREAERRGVSVDSLVIDLVRKHVPDAPTEVEKKPGSYFDMVRDYLGKVEGTGEPLAETCGERFAAYLEEKRKRGKL
jgi:hypothetical protein